MSSSSIQPVTSVDETSLDTQSQYDTYQQYWDSVEANDKDMTTTELDKNLEYNSAKGFYGTLNSQISQEQQDEEEMNPDNAGEISP